MNDNTDNEREHLENSFNESLDDMTKAVINFAIEVYRLKLQKKLAKRHIVVDCSFDFYNSIVDNAPRAWIDAITYNPDTNKVVHFESIFESTIDDLKVIYDRFVAACNEAGYITRTWEQIQSNDDFIRYIS